MLSWSPTNPDFTFCFKQSVLIWVPCTFLWTFSILDINRRSQSRFSDIPWSILNLSKLILMISILCLLIVDLSMMLSIADANEIFAVQYVSLGILVATFVS